MQPKFHLDEQLSPEAERVLRRRGIDVTSAYSVGLVGEADTVQLAYCIESGRVLVTLDDDFLKMVPGVAKHPGIVFWTRHHATLSDVVYWIGLIHEVYDAHELEGRIEFIP